METAQQVCLTLLDDLSVLAFPYGILGPSLGSVLHAVH